MISRDKSYRLRGGMKIWPSILNLTFDTTRTAQMSVPRSGRTSYHQGNSLVLISLID